MRQFFTLLLFLSIGSAIQAQAIYSQDFADGFGDMILVDNDGLTAATNVSAFSAAWTISDNFGDSNGAVSNSWYAPPGVSDDWMITPTISGVTGKTVLLWSAKAQDSSFPDGYEVLISTTGSDLSAFTTVLFEVGAENPEFTERSVSLSDYEGMDINIAWRNNSNDKFLLVVDDILVIEFKDNDAAAVSAVTNRYTLTNEPATINYTIKNNGVLNMTDLEFTWSNGLETLTETISGIDVAFGSTYDGQLMFTPALAEQYDIDITITSINGVDDEDGTNNAAATVTNGVSKAVAKKLIAEEATGTWCQFCPRGAVFMDLMAEQFSDEFIGIAVHNADPMAVTEYDAGLNDIAGFPGYPSVAVNRQAFIDPSDLPTYLELVTRNEYSPIEASISQSRNGTSIDVVGEFAFFTKIENADLSLVTVIVEDGVTGTTPGYDQVNAYSGGTVQLGGYELLPNPVPAADMVYNEVGRELIGGYGGDAAAVPTDIIDGTTIPISFSYDIPAAFDYNNIHVAMFIVDNATGIAISGAKTTSFATNVTDVTNLDGLSIFPNPTSGFTNVSLDLNKSSNIQMNIINSVGQVVGSRDYGQMSGKQVLPIDASQFNSGIYYIRLSVDGQVTSKKLIVE